MVSVRPIWCAYSERKEVVRHVTVSRIAFVLEGLDACMVINPLTD